MSQDEKMTITETMRSIRRKADRKEMALGDQFTKMGIENPLIHAHLDIVMGPVLTKESVSKTPRMNPNWPEPRT